MRLERNTGPLPQSDTGLGKKTALPLRARGDGVNRTQGPGSLKKGSPEYLKAEKARIEHVAQEFEALMLEKMMAQMRGAIPETDLMGGGGRGKQIFQEMLDGEYAKNMEKHGGLGLGRFLTHGLEAAEFGQNPNRGLKSMGANPMPMAQGKPLLARKAELSGNPLGQARSSSQGNDR